MSFKNDFEIKGVPFQAKCDLVACGAELKNTFVLIGSGKMFISKINGDLENLDNFLLYERRIGAALKNLNIKPRLVCCDLHPEYLSTKFAQDFAEKHRVGLEYIQHHHAHVASCMFENQESGKAIGVAFDGTGYGTDERLWGGEFLVFDYRNFKRQAHLQYIPLAGGNKSILEPWRLAAAWAHSIYKDRFLELKIDFVNGLNHKKWQLIKQMLEGEINSPLSSSMGRLFDAVSALLDIREVVAYEGQAAIELERAANKFYPQKFSAYKFAIERKEVLVINPRAIFLGIIEDLKNKVEIGKIALKFHYSIAQMIKEVCILIRKEGKLNKVFLSGGVFQNKILKEKASQLLGDSGFKVFTHLISPNDSCISIGQAIVGLHRQK